MANLVLRTLRPTRSALSALDTWDPFQVMDSLLNREAAWPAQASGAEAATFNPHFDVKETKEGYHFTADLPGVKEADLDISMTGNRLTISGKRESGHREEGQNFFVYERAHGAFTRAFTLPDSADMEHARAELKDGVLNILLPKKAAAQPRKIQLGGASQNKA